MLRPILRAAPVTSATRPSKGNSATAGLPAPSGRDNSGHPAPEHTTPPAPVNRAFDAVGAAAYNQAPSVRRSGGAMKLDLLAIAAHPDDVELTCGGTLIKMVENGYKVGILDLTEGEMGTRGTVEIRRRAILAYASQFKPGRRAPRSKIPLPLDRLEQEVHLIAGYYGQMIGVEYAEPFLVREVMQVEDVVKLPVRSM